MSLIKKHSTLFIFVLLAIILVFTASNVKWGGSRWDSIIRHDGKGYYAYLPAAFIYHDLSFSFYDEIENGKYYIAELEYDYRGRYNGAVVNKYYMGTALAELPFFLMAHVFSTPLGFENDGYSKIYHIFISIAGLFYMLLGLYLLWKVLLLYQIKKSNINIVLISMALGTHLFYYSVFEPCMSHVYSFAFVNAFILFSKKYFLKHEAKDLIISSFLFAIIILIRPVNGLIIFVLPFLAGSYRELKISIVRLFSKDIMPFVLASLVFLAVVSLQGIVYYLQTGSFIVYSYGNEGFYFLDSQVFNILFSYKKGLFLYTPLCFLSLLGAYYQYHKNKFEVFSLLAFFIILTYVLASWWNWWYGGSFSSRVYIEYLFVFALLLGIALENISNKKWRNVFLICLGLLILFNQKQTYLYRTGHIHYEDMDKAWYWKSVFDHLLFW